MPFEQQDPTDGHDSDVDDLSAEDDENVAPQRAAGENGCEHGCTSWQWTFAVPFVPAHGLPCSPRAPSRPAAAFRRRSHIFPGHIGSMRREESWSRRHKVSAAAPRLAVGAAHQSERGGIHRAGAHRSRRRFVVPLGENHRRLMEPLASLGTWLAVGHETGVAWARVVPTAPASAARSRGAFCPATAARFRAAGRIAPAAPSAVNSSRSAGPIGQLEHGRRNLWKNNLLNKLDQKKF